MFAISFIAACSSGSSKPEDTEVYIDIPLGVLVDDVQIADGITQYAFKFDVPVSDKFTDLNLDLTETLSSVNIVSPAPRSKIATKQVTASMLVRIGEDEGTVCDYGEEYGPFSISVDDSSNSADAITPDSVTATQSTMNVVNKGSFYVCMIIDSPQSAILSAGSLSINSTDCKDEPMNVSGEWTGTYNCTNTGTSEFCDDDINKDISLTITQSEDLYTATYDDGLAQYSGTVCGNIFKYNGGDRETFNEEGKFVFDGTNATKTSSWQGIDYDCRGVCTDNLSFGELF
jgi:hypothetical protein